MKIAIVQGFDSTMSELDKITTPKWEEYAKNHGYGFIRYEHDIPDDNHPAMIIEKSLLRAMEDPKYAEYDWFFWRDIDSLVMNTDITLESYLEQPKVTPRTEVIIGGLLAFLNFKFTGDSTKVIDLETHSFPWFITDTSHMLIHRSQYSINLLTNVIRDNRFYTEELNPKLKEYFDCFTDEIPMSLKLRFSGDRELGKVVYLHVNEFWGPSDYDYVTDKRIVHKTAGSLHLPVGSPWYSYTPGMFAIHPAGRTYEDKIRVLTSALNYDVYPSPSSATPDCFVIRNVTYDLISAFSVFRGDLSPALHISMSRGATDFPDILSYVYKVDPNTILHIYGKDELKRITSGTATRKIAYHISCAVSEKDGKVTLSTEDMTDIKKSIRGLNVVSINILPHNLYLNGSISRVNQGSPISDSIMTWFLQETGINNIYLDTLTPAISGYNAEQCYMISAGMSTFADGKWQLGNFSITPYLPCGARTMFVNEDGSISRCPVKRKETLTGMSIYVNKIHDLMNDIETYKNVLSNALGVDMRRQSICRDRETCLRR